MSGMRTHLAIVVTAILFAAVAATARADGLPLLGSGTGPAGIEAPNGHVRFATLPAGHGTVLVSTERIGGHVVGYRYFDERLTIPNVAYDGSVGGLSRDGSTLVLMRPRVGFPQRETAFALVDTKGLKVVDRVTLHGDFSFDAISPDGGTLYFIQYLSRRDPTRYAVRAYDVQAGRFLREPIVDRSEPDEDMRGNPITRVTSADGRWAYTLYDGGGMAPFIHALDTVGAEAHCIDLDALAGRQDLFDLRLRLGGGTLAVTKRGVPLSVVDLATLRVSEPAPRPPSGGGGVPWLPIGAGAGALLTAAVSLVVLRRRKLALGT
jgi:hypothetical protein